MLEVTKTLKENAKSTIYQETVSTWVVFQFVILLQFSIVFINIIIIKFIIIIINVIISNNTRFKYITLTQFHFVLFCFVFFLVLVLACFLSFRTWQENKILWVC